MEKDLLEKIQELREESLISKTDDITLHLSKRELDCIYIWIKTAWANDDALNEVLDSRLKKYKR